MDVHASVRRYEAWLRCELGPEVDEEGLQEKRRDIAEKGPHAFLRGTYWLWAEMADSFIPGIASVPATLAIGDIHVENFGTWRDAEGRLVWGVNDHDEAAEMPYLLDLVRLATSAFLAAGDRDPVRPAAAGRIAAAVVRGYADGLAEPRPHLLDGHPEEDEAAQDLAEWFRDHAAVPRRERRKFWDKLGREWAASAGDPGARMPPARFAAALRAALPRDAEAIGIWRRRSGLGSLGRPRWVARAAWRGGFVVREAKGVVPSAWVRAHGGGTRATRCMEVATGPWRAPDPWYHVADGIAIRRLSPNNRKIEAKRGKDGKAGAPVGLDTLLDDRMLEAMARDLAAVHLGTPGAAAPIRADFRDRVEGPALLLDCARSAEAAMLEAWRAFRS
jgi:hypothetical protein